MADTVRDFFSGVSNQAKSAYRKEVGGVEYFADVAFTLTNINQFKTDNYYLVLLKGSDMYIAPNSVSRMVATMALRIKNHNGVYNYNQEKAFVAAIDASNDGSVRVGEEHRYTINDFEVSKYNALSIRLRHFHPYTSNAHSFFGVPL